MSRNFALRMTYPHEMLGLPQPLGRRLPQGIAAWNIGFVGIVAILSIFYVIQVNRAASRGFQLRDVERRVDGLSVDVRSLEDQVATMSSVDAMKTRAAQLGFVPIDHIQFLNPAKGSFAMAR